MTVTVAGYDQESLRPAGNTVDHLTVGPPPGVDPADQRVSAGEPGGQPGTTAGGGVMPSTAKHWRRTANYLGHLLDNDEATAPLTADERDWAALLRDRLYQLANRARGH